MRARALTGGDVRGLKLQHRRPETSGGCEHGIRAAAADKPQSAAAQGVPHALVSREQSAVISQLGVGTPTSQTGAAFFPSGKFQIAAR
jgi:hypothetical protein